MDGPRLNVDPFGINYRQAKNYTELPLSILSQSRFFSFFFGLIKGEKKIHFFLIGFAIALISSIQPAYYIYRYGIPYLKNTEKRIITIIDEVYPNNLQITIKNGIAKTNVQEPYHLTISKSSLEELTTLKPQKQSFPNRAQRKLRLITLNTQGSIEDFERFQSLAMLTDKNLVYYDNSEVKLGSLSNAPNLVITKKFIKDKFDQLYFKKGLSTLVYSLLYLSPVFLTALNLVYFFIVVLWWTTIGFIICRILNLEITFKKIIPLVAIIFGTLQLILVILKWISPLVMFYSWIATFADALALCILYMILNQYKKITAQV